ncbi:antibiotic biosynthesis monooxygenase [Pseudomonas sp. SWI6]|uniref:Antibiotic biosynthesis monooxygenase n=1 Tax=Pseudomonas taiwanensis TaxID=470150 RepID=A0ABR6VEQ6_9PSED|nr:MULTISPECIES: antibiotic biosynthesis monooxygenase [Pseudomonas]AGZ37750.1 antibiotic biosynthesis monooxygenase [Pseudomonas sp. VLB120]AVD80970.1 antibiotic biosynthesis monooxygenase [Pseudomonas sp. SWI6]MBC3478904.1 antibiotic biosynthesis monooxygenase [Pseudomonas taiwanensis]MBC3494300.1 antibiotic biosynthesis monooxygenase [Pseudomonas taiwanensis]MDT8926767.1 antibiotic biosynthesis monooxygenase [Pseudomonas taiwanensis]
MNTAFQDNRNVVTLVIQHKVRAESLAGYEAWLKRTVSTARRQPGHLDVNVIRPDDGGRHFTTVVRFADASLLQAWVNSAERQALVEEVLPLLEDGDHTQVHEDPEFWFTPPSTSVAPPPRWKQALLTYLVICPMTLVIPQLLAPLFAHFPLLGGRVTSNLIVNLFVILPVVFYIMPWVTRRCAKWLRG